MRNEINYIIKLLLSTLFFTQCLIFAGSIDGTISPKYLNTNQVLRNSNYVNGFVKLNDGATILNDAITYFNMTRPISVGLDLRETGVISLYGNLNLDANFTITSNGVIRGNGKTVFMNGDLTLSDSNYVRVLHVNTDTIIDGCGHSLIIGRNAKLFVDDNITLTLKNIIIKPTLNCNADPCIKLASNRSKLALDNVKFDLVQDFDFGSGQLFVHNDVAITGTSAFIYRSSQPSFITSGATLYFDLGTTLSVVPATFTDCKFDQWPTYTSNNFIKMTDKTSKLFLNGADLCSNFTGCRFTKGTLSFDNNLMLNSNSGMTISSSDPATSIGSVETVAAPWFVSFSPNGQFVSVLSMDSNTLQVFRFNEGSASTLVGSIATAANPRCAQWSPDGRYIAVACYNSFTLEVFSFSGTGNPIFVGDIRTVSSPNPIFLAWSPDGNFISMINFNSATLQIFSFNGRGNPVFVSSASVGTHPRCVSWSPDGRSLCVAGDSSLLQIFRFDGATSLNLVGDVYTAITGTSVSWSPDGRFIALVSYYDNLLKIFSFNGIGAPVFIGSVGTTSPAQGLWAADGKFIATVNYGSWRVSIFSFSGTGDPISNGFVYTESATPYSFSLSNDGKFIAVVDSGISKLQTFKINYFVDRSGQAMANGIVFGNSAPSFDPTVNVLGGAYLEAYGKINYDRLNLD